MQVILLILVTCELCWTIRVPVTWSDGESEVKNEADEFSFESFKPQSVESPKPSEKPIPVEYFEYTAKKPQFAVDVAAFHGVQSPENHYRAYPIKPYTGRAKPELGYHRILDGKNTLHKPFQDYTSINEDKGQITPVSSKYEVFHPYEAETPALQEIYKDPILNKIRNDLENSKNRLQKYEKEAGEPDITKDEYLQDPEKTDGKLFPHRYKPAPFELHRPQRRPIYYRPAPVYKHREQYLNHKLRHPWNHNIAKVRPMHYIPIKNHIHQLRQNHALKYDDERNEYPQVAILENYSDPKDGYDIYEKGRDKFVHLRNNVDESINKAVEENRPAKYHKLEMQNDDSSLIDDEEDEEEFVPIKNYAQVRKTETFKHLPKIAALDDAETYDEIKNAPRLREAVKSTKAQTVYSEEGYEDAAYDHAGEQKHASENEGHGGLLKEHELSGGKYKAPSLSNNYEDGKGSTYKDQLIHAQKWNDENKDSTQEVEEEDYSEDEHEHLLEAEKYQTDPQNEDEGENNRDKRENKNKIMFNPDLQSNISKVLNKEHEVDKREIHFEVPVVDFNSTFLNIKDIKKLSKLKEMQKKDTIKQKYPYYFQNFKSINKHSPLRYAENLKLIPMKSKGGTEFYDSRYMFECPEVEDVPDPIPQKLKKDGHPDEVIDSPNESSIKEEVDADTSKKQPRLGGLGDKIDCFKAKYFGKNPLDSPFFKEDIISNPEPVFVPNIAAYKSNAPFNNKHKESAEIPNYSLELAQKGDLFAKIPIFQLAQGSRRNDVEENTKMNITLPTHHELGNKSKELVTGIGLNHIDQAGNVTYSYFQDKKDVTKPLEPRKKRATPFVYEPYKIIRDIQIQDDNTKKLVTSSNSGPLIKQLQSSRVVDRDINTDETQHSKRNINSRINKNIGKKNKDVQLTSKNDRSVEDSEIIDVSSDKRRGEPRYEIKHVNHKSRYTPVTNKKSMTKEDYETQVGNERVPITRTRGESSTTRPTRLRRPITEKAYFDITKFIPHTKEEQNAAVPNTVRKTVSISTSTIKPQDSSDYNKSIKDGEENESEEDYEEYDDTEEEETITSSTTTTSKPVFRRKTRTQITTEEPIAYTEEPKLKLVTRFRDYKPLDSHNIKESEEKKTAAPWRETHKNHDESIAPKFREKKKKVTKSTIVTDTKKYGNGDDDMLKDEIDAMIGNTHDMDDYVPLYEKNEEIRSKQKASKVGMHSPNKERTDYRGNTKVEEEEEDEDNNDDINDDIDSDDDDVVIDDSDEDDTDVYEEEEDDEDEDSNINEAEEQGDIEQELRTTTPEPTKRTLIITTDAPMPTIASRSARLQEKPIITRKTIEIHKELPRNKSSPHMTEFKQDIKEIEIIKETPKSSRIKQPNPLKRKPNKNAEVLDFYKDDNLAKDINKLSVEIFKENLDLRTGPKHGGNYRSTGPSDISPSDDKLKHTKDDAEASQSEYKKHIEIDNETPTKSRISKPRSRERNSELVELRDSSLHGGNLKYHNRQRNTNHKNEKLIELQEEDDDDPSSDSYEQKSYSNSRNGPRMHGGNYRSAKLIEKESPDSKESTNAERPKDVRRNAALVLNSFVQAAPVLSTTVGYIVDPSKRKYYYVDT